MGTATDWAGQTCDAGGTHVQAVQRSVGRSRGSTKSHQNRSAGSQGRKVCSHHLGTRATAVSRDSWSAAMVEESHKGEHRKEHMTPVQWTWVGRAERQFSQPDAFQVQLS